jgi:hypothetical protein
MESDPMRRHRSILISLLLLAVTPAAASAAPCAAQASGAWTSAGTWTACNGGTPGAGDSATIAAPWSVTVASTTVGGVTLDGGSLAVSGTVNSTAAIAVTANGGTVTGGGTLHGQGAGGTLAIAGATTIAAGSTVDSATAGLAWSGGPITLAGGSNLTPAGAWTVTTDGVLNGDPASSTSIAGGVAIGTHTVAIGAPTMFGNGDITVGNGDLFVAADAGGTTANSISVGTVGGPGSFHLTAGDLSVATRLGSPNGVDPANAVLSVAGASTTLTRAGTTGGFAATTLSTGATLDVQTSLTVGTLTVTGGATITGGGTVTATGNSTVDAGGLTFAGGNATFRSGGLTVGAGSLAFATGTYVALQEPATLNGTSLDLTGNANSNGQIRLTGSAVLTLGAGVTSTGSGRIAVDSTSTVAKTDTSAIALTWTINAPDGGIISSAGGGLAAPLAGAPKVLIALGAEVTDRGTTLNDGTSITGQGIFGVATGTTLTGTFTTGALAPGLLEIGGGARFTIHAAVDKITLPRIIVSNNGTLALQTNAGDPALTLPVTTLVLHGGTISGGVNTKITVSGTSNVDNGVIGLPLTSQGPTFLSGDATVDAPWTIPTGVTLSTAPGAFVTGVGRIVLAGGSLDPDGALELAGLEIGAGGHVSLTNTTPLSIALGAGRLAVDTGGTLSGSGSIDGSLTNAGVVAITGTLTVTGGFQQDTTGRLDVGIRSATDVDTLTVNGPVTLAGTLHDTVAAAAYDPAPDTAVRPLHAAATPTGAFTTIDAPLLDGRSWIVGDYAVNPVSLIIHYTTPTSATAPAVTGDPHAGATLTCTPGTWNNRPLTYTYAWSIDGVLDASAMAATYVVPVSAVVHAVSCTQTGTNPAGSASATSTGVTIGPLATVPPATGGGTPVLGADVTCSVGTWTGAATTAIAWLRDGTPIGGAVNPTYHVATPDLGHALACRVTATGPSASTTVVTTTPTTIVAGLKAAIVKVDGKGRLVMAATCARSESRCSGTIALIVGGRTIGKAKVKVGSKRATAMIRLPKSLRNTLRGGKKVKAILSYGYANGSSAHRAYRLPVTLHR